MAVSASERAFYVTLGRRIATLRKAQGLTQVQLAEAMGVAQQTVVHYEAGRLRLLAGALPNLADQLGVSVEELIARQPNAAPASADRRRSCSSSSSACRRYRRRSSGRSRRCWTRCLPRISKQVRRLETAARSDAGLVLHGFKKRYLKHLVRSFHLVIGSLPLKNDPESTSIGWYRERQGEHQPSLQARYPLPR